MKKCYKGIKGNGEAVIRQLEKEGGINRWNCNGRDTYKYYYISENGMIRHTTIPPSDYELAELPIELPIPREVYVSDESVADAYFTQQKRTLIAEVTINGEMFYVCENTYRNYPIIRKHIVEIPQVPEQTFTESQIKDAIKNINPTIVQFILEKLKQNSNHQI